MHPTFAKGEERIVYAGAVIQVAVGEFTTPDGRHMEREIVRHPGAVAVVPVDGDEAVLVRQYRAALDAELLEIPAGKRDVAGEAPERCAARELVEETGLAAGRLELLASFYNSAGFSDELTLVYLGLDLREEPGQAHGLEEEYMTVERVHLDDVPAMIGDQRIQDAKTIVGLLGALRYMGR